MDKSELLEWLRAENEQWERLLERIGRERMELPGVNGAWSFKDVVAHLNGWQARLVEVMRATELGEPRPAPPWPLDLPQEDDPINAWIYETNRDRPLEAVLDETRRYFEQLLVVIEELPEEATIEREWRIVNLKGKRYGAGNFFDHYHDDHEPDVQAWLARIEPA